MTVFNGEVWRCDVQATIEAKGSSSSSSQSTKQEDARVAADNGGIAIGSRAKVTIDATSPEVFDLTEQLIDVGGAIVEDAFGFVTDANDFVAQVIGDQADQVLKLIGEQGRSEEATLASQALKIGLPLVLAGVAIYGITRSK